MTTEVQQVQATKRCNKCLEEKAVDLFALDRKSSDQRQWRCKVCQAAYHAENRSKILPRMAAYGRAYSRNAYIEIKADPEKYAKYLAENAIAKKRSIEKNPDRQRARVAVCNAIRTGKMERPNHCSQCGIECKPEAHHDSYEKSQWFNVRFLCNRCHDNLHHKYPDLPK